MSSLIESVRDGFYVLAKNSNIALGDLYLQASSGHHVFLDDGKIEETGSSASSGIGARLLRDNVTFYSSRSDSNGTSAQSVIDEIADLADLKRVKIKKGPSILLPPKLERFESAHILHQVNSQIRNLSSKVTQVALSMSSSVKSVLIIRDDGHIVKDLRKYAIFSVNVIVEDRGEVQTGYRVQAKTGTLTELLKSFDILKLGESALEGALRTLESPKCPAGTMPVILAGEAGGTMIHEACGHGMEADIIKKDYSVYRDKIGQQVASPLVTIVDDGTLDGLYGSYKTDDEGNVPEKTVLVENGVLKSYMTDRETSLTMNLPLTGNGRRASYKVPPKPRMSNTFVEPGKSLFKDLLGSIDNGLLVRKMGGGEVNPTSGDYVFQVTEGYLVKKGKILNPVRGAVLAGNGPETLKHIIGVGGDLQFEPGMCGKGGQSVPVSDGQPALLLDHITVGGSSTS